MLTRRGIMRKSLKERWIQAMCKIPLSLIGYNGYAKEEASLCCQCFREHPPNNISLEKVLGLENETKDLLLVSTFDELFTGNDSVTNLEAVIKPIKAKQQRQRKPEIVHQPNPDNYPIPWCRVIKDGQLIRYEDANGQIIPKVLWQ